MPIARRTLLAQAMLLAAAPASPADRKLKVVVPAATPAIRSTDAAEPSPAIRIGATMSR